MTKVKKITALFTVMVALLTATIFLPQQSLAEEATTADLTVYNPGKYTCEMLPGQLVEALVNCITTPIKKAVLKPANGATKEIGLLAFVSQYMARFLVLVIVLAVVIFGLKVFNVRNAPHTVGIGLLIRIGIAAMLVNNFGGFATELYNVFDFIVNLGNNSGTTVWKQIDGFLGDLLGFFTDSKNDIDKGIMALLNGSIFAKGLGIMITTIGIFAVTSLLIFVFQAMYLYLSSFIAFSFLLAISPIFVLFFVFGYTERFFSKWFELITATVLTPMLMFAFLGVFLDTQPAGGGAATPGIIREAVNDIFIALGNGSKDLGKDYIKRCITPAQPLTGSYILSADANMADRLACPPPLLPGCSEQDKRNSSVQTWLNPFLFNNLNYVEFRVVKLDCGINDEEIKQKVILALLALFLYVTFINSMIHRIPDISTDLANGVSVGVSHISSPITSILNSIKR